MIEYQAYPILGASVSPIVVPDPRQSVKRNLVLYNHVTSPRGGCKECRNQLGFFLFACFYKQHSFLHIQPNHKGQVTWPLDSAEEEQLLKGGTDRPHSAWEN